MTSLVLDLASCYDRSSSVAKSLGMAPDGGRKESSDQKERLEDLEFPEHSEFLGKISTRR